MFRNICSIPSEAKYICPVLRTREVFIGRGGRRGDEDNGGARLEEERDRGGKDWRKDKGGARRIEKGQKKLTSGNKRKIKTKITSSVIP
jgi:hypothetical protein